MRQLTGFLALTVAVAYLTLRPSWYRFTIIASSIPIAMTANVARVVLTGYIMHFVNPEFASGAYHTAEGLLMMGFGLTLLRTECWILDQIVALTSPRTPDVLPGAPHHASAERANASAPQVAGEVYQGALTGTETLRECPRARMDDVTTATSLAL